MRSEGFYVNEKSTDTSWDRIGDFLLYIIPVLRLTLRTVWIELYRHFFFYNYNQQDATIFDYLFLKGATCFGLFLRPSSAAHNCTLSFSYCQPILLQAAIVAQ